MSSPPAARPQTVTRFFYLFALILAAVLTSCQPSPVAGESATPVPVSESNSSEVVVLRVNGQQTYQTQQTTLGDFLSEIGVEVQSNERLLADGRELDSADWSTSELPRQIIIDPYKTITLVVNDQSQSLRTSAVTVGDALVEAAITLGSGSEIDPAIDTPLVNEMLIHVEQAAPYRIAVDGQTIEAASEAVVVGDILSDTGIVLGELDRTQPAISATVQSGSMIQVIRVAESFETADEPIPYETVYLPNENMPLDTQAFTSGGSPGILRRQTRILYENGIEIAREPAEEWVEQEPVNEVISYGTQITVQTMDTPEGPIEYWRVVNMRVASYTPSSAGKKPGEPGYGITASGMQAGKGVVAVDPTVVPFRSSVYVPGYGVAIAGDTGGGVKGRFVDLGYSDDNYEHWHGTVDVYYMTPIPPADKIRYILP